MPPSSPCPETGDPKGQAHERREVATGTSGRDAIKEEPESATRSQRESEGEGEGEGEGERKRSPRQARTSEGKREKARESEKKEAVGIESEGKGPLPSDLSRSRDGQPSTSRVVRGPKCRRKKGGRPRRLEAKHWPCHDHKANDDGRLCERQAATPPCVPDIAVSVGVPARKHFIVGMILPRSTSAWNAGLEMWARALGPRMARGCSTNGVDSRAVRSMVAALSAALSSR
jgi:hypothetical protein